MSIGDKVRIAIESECSAIKAGNIHPRAAYEDLNFGDFVAAAKAIGNAVDRSAGQSVGAIVLESVRAMMEAVRTNTSLGTILLLAPLIATQHRILTKPIPFAINQTLAELTPKDSQDIYQAIQMAKPGGLGNTDAMDVRENAPTCILDAMRLAAEWDDIALQYVSQFELVFDLAARLTAKQASGFSMSDAIRCLQMELLSERIDSLIARKQGSELAKEVQKRAIRVIESGPFGSDAYEAEWQRFDKGLRDDQHRGNPGTIADLIAAAVFVREL
jgi:triphosphoribosyl-dephospho-CoA synthase